MPTGFDERVWERRQLKVKKFEFDMNEGKCSGTSTGGIVCVCVCLVMTDLREEKKKKRKEKKNKRVTGME